MGADDLIFISRQEMELGKLSVREATELLRAGFLLPSDEFWTASNQERVSLAQLGKCASAVSPGWVARAKDSVVATTGAVVQGAGRLGSKVSETFRGGTPVLSLRFQG